MQQLCTCYREIQKELASTSGSWSISCWLQKTKPKEKHHSNMPDDDILWKPWWWKPKWISTISGTSNLDKFYDYWWGDTNQLPELKQNRNNGLFLEVVHSIVEVFGHFFLSHVVSSRAFATEVFLLFPSLFTCLNKLSSGHWHDTSVAGELNSLISSYLQNHRERLRTLVR